MPSRLYLHGSTFRDLFHPQTDCFSINAKSNRSVRELFQMTPVPLQTVASNAYFTGDVCVTSQPECSFVRPWSVHAVISPAVRCTPAMAHVTLKSALLINITSRGCKVHQAVSCHIKKTYLNTLKALSKARSP